MLQIVFEDGVFCPTVCCDYCGGRIKDATMGNFLWIDATDYDAGVSHNILFAHKQCTRLLETRDKPYKAYMCDELTRFMRFLLTNTSMKPKDLEEPLVF